MQVDVRLNLPSTISHSTNNETAFSINYILSEDEVTVYDSNDSRKQYIDVNTISKATVKVRLFDFIDIRSVKCLLIPIFLIREHFAKRVEGPTNHCINIV